MQDAKNWDVRGCVLDVDACETTRWFQFELLDDVELVVETFEVVEVFLSDSRPEEDHTGND